MGTTIDGFDNTIRRPKNKSEKASHLKWIKFSVLVVVFVAALMSVQLAGFVDPISLFTRTVVTVLYPMFVLAADGFTGLLMSIPLLEEPIFRVSEFFRGVILPIHISIFRNSVFIAVIFMIILGLGYYHRRFWCRNLCPLGALLGIFSRFRFYRRQVSDACTQCGLCRKKCRMDAIAPDFIITDQVECISCMDCIAVCPVHAVRFGFTKSRDSVKVDYNRRRLLAAGTTGLFTIGLLKIGFTKPLLKGKVIRPPGALEEPEFLDRCIRCGECIRVCSTSGAGLQYATLESGWDGIWTPVLLSQIGYCEYNCSMCGEVCPTGAIKSLPLEERQKMKMGTAHFDKTRCIPWYYGENCMVCEEHCPLPDKAIKFREEETITIDGKDTNVLLPYVDESLCIGCGICVTRCPVEGERGIFLTNAEEDRWI